MGLLDQRKWQNALPFDILDLCVESTIDFEEVVEGGGEVPRHSAMEGQHSTAPSLNGGA